MSTYASTSCVRQPEDESDNDNEPPEDVSSYHPVFTVQ